MGPRARADEVHLRHGARFLRTLLMKRVAFALYPAIVCLAGAPGAQDPEATPATLALGDSVFHGKAGAALCYVCHGPAGKGVAGLGPNLTDKEWLNGDGSVAFIEKTVTEGVPKPKKAPAPMPPK